MKIIQTWKRNAPSTLCGESMTLTINYSSFDKTEIDDLEKKTLYDVCVSAITLLKEQGWNVLTEDADGFIHGLPGDDGQYLMTDGKDIWIDDFVDGVTDGIILDSGRDIREIKAWMYMPELPKKESR